MSPALVTLVALAGCAPGWTARARVDGSAPVDASGFATVEVGIRLSEALVEGAARHAEGEVGQPLPMESLQHGILAPDADVAAATLSGPLGATEAAGPWHAVADLRALCPPGQPCSLTARYALQSSRDTVPWSVEVHTRGRGGATPSGGLEILPRR